MKDENTSMDGLAIMVKEGFDRIEEKMATKEGLNNLKIDMDNQFSEVNRRLDNLESLITGEYRIRIERLEENVSTLMKATGLVKI
ncbi:MAG: hypothetical protein HOF76_02125 [Candidatus Scalindua sp.]|jgi:hypothetical protein|nr:hypothetical protein [Candidatus Scalindua sp.]MBT7592118.1 hypothetical protein [Candidatus Scalindua sp.]